MLHPDLSAFVASLNEAKADFLVVGAHALAFHGRPRFTGDLDLFVRQTPENAGRVVRALEDFGFGALGVSDSDLLEAGTIVQIGRPPNRIDLLTALDGVSFEQAWQRRVAAEIGGVPVCYISREDLIANKRAVGRPRDLSDIADLD